MMKSRLARDTRAALTRLKTFVPKNTAWGGGWHARRIHLKTPAQTPLPQAGPGGVVTRWAGHWGGAGCVEVAMLPYMWCSISCELEFAALFRPKLFGEELPPRGDVSDFDSPRSSHSSY